MSVTAMETRLTGKHILLILLGAFAVIGTVNAIFIYFALSTGPARNGAPAMKWAYATTISLPRSVPRTRFNGITSRKSPKAHAFASRSLTMREPLSLAWP